MCKDDIKIAQSYISKSTSSDSRGIKFELTFTQYKRLYNTLTCAYTKEKVTHGSTWSIDRMNNDEGYTQKNCVICKKDLNGRKSNLTITEMKKIIRVWEKKNLSKS